MGKGSAASAQTSSFWPLSSTPTAPAGEDIYDLLEKGFISDIPLDCLRPPAVAKKGGVKCYVKRNAKNSFGMYVNGNDRLLLQAERKGADFEIKEGGVECGASSAAAPRVLGRLTRKDTKDGYLFRSEPSFDGKDDVLSMLHANGDCSTAVDEMDITHGKRTLKQATVHTMTVRSTHVARRSGGQDDSSSTSDSGRFVLSSKLPKWNERIGSLTLNFHGRAKLASAKNFQLRVGDTDQVAVLFGKLTSDTFALDYQSPCSPVQAFALAMCVHEWN